ncbi:MAG: M48 family metalloprotease [Bacteroidetes bacterium]|nr:M48 family metalloprotease [Bacteroidota bacterium]
MTLAYILISYVSRKREYAADKYSAELAGKHKMISALQSLESQPELKTESKRDSIVFSKIHNKKKVYLFETHPHIEDRIASLNKL